MRIEESRAERQILQRVYSNAQPIAGRPRFFQSLKEDVMLRTLAVATFVAIISFAPAYAAGECTDAHMKQMDDMIAKMSDAAKKKEATMHLDMSKAEMKKGNEAGCMEHMNAAHKAMGM